jgi:hypothetical protein
VNITPIKPGDIVECDVRGSSFFAKADTIAKDFANRKVLNIEPLSPKITYRQATPRQVVGHYRKSKASR